MLKPNRYLYLVIGIVVILSTAFFMGCTTAQTPATNTTVSTTTTPSTISGLSWTFVDGNDSQKGINMDVLGGWGSPQITVCNSKLYATWDESTSIGQVRVAVFNGNNSSPAWTFVDHSLYGINFNKDRFAYDPQLTEFNSKLYAIWSEISETRTNRQIRVAVYNGNDSSPEWASLSGLSGINKNVTWIAIFPQLAVFNSKLYATWSESDGVLASGQIRVAVYNGNDASPGWTFVDGNGTNGINKDTGQNARGPQLTVFNSKLYATWQEDNGTKPQVRVAVFNGNDSSPVWAFVDGNGTNGINKDTSQIAGGSQLTVYNSKLYNAWVEHFGPTGQVTYTIRVVVYNGNDSSPVWTFVDGNGAKGILKSTDPNAMAMDSQLTVYNSNLYMTWDEYNGINRQIRVAAFNGDDSNPIWTFVDGNGNNGINKDPANPATYPQLTVFNSKLYATWQESSGPGGGSWQARVAVGQ